MNPLLPRISTEFTGYDFQSEYPRRDLNGKLDGDGIKRGELSTSIAGAIAPILIGKGTAPSESLQSLKSLGGIPETEVISIRNTTIEETNKVNEIRQSNRISKNKNVAFAEGEIGGESYYRESHSGQDSKPGTAVSRSFKDQNLPTRPTSNDIKKGQINADRRAYDSEAKILEEILEQTENNSNISGKIKLVSERTICESCTDAITAFEKMRPNIKVERVHIPK